MNSAFLSLLFAVSASVGYDAGNRPKFLIDGQVHEPLIDCCGHPSGGRNDYTNVCAYIRRSTAAFGHRILNLGILDREYRRSDGTYDWSVLDTRAKLFLEADPEAKFLIGIRFMYEKWAEQHPDERVGYAGSPLVNGSGDEYMGTPVRPSSASKLFRAEIFRDLAALAEHIRNVPWGERVVAVRPCYGCYTEWFSYGTLAFPDCGRVMTEYFRDWLKRRYGSDEALRAAWRDTTVSLDTATVPSRREQSPQSFFLDATCGRRAIDFNRAQADSMADLLISVAQEIKRLLPGRMVGAYYGYVFEALPGSCAVGLYDRVLSSGAVDFFSNPPAYCHDSRKPGGDYGQKLVASSLRRYGKIAVLEDDSRLHFMSNWATKGWCMDDARADRAVLRRNVLNTFFDGCGYQICDPIQGRGQRLHSFDNPAVLDALSETFGVLRGIAAVPLDSEADMALVITSEDKFFTNTQYFQGESDQRNPYLDAQWGIYRGIPLWLHRSGAVFDIVRLEDLLVSDKSYKTLVFQSAYALNETQRKAVMHRMRRSGTTSVWFLAPGSITDDGFSDAAMSDLVGMKLRGAGSNPQVVSEDAAARPLAVCGGWCKDLADGARTFFFPSVPRSAAEAGALMDAIGEHRYVRDDAYVRRLGDYLMVHVGKAGRYEIRLPQPAATRELFSGVDFPKNHCSIESSGPETWLLKVMPDPYAALRHAALERPRGLVYNTDGCDILYWPTNMPVSVEAFKNRRLVYALDSRITTVSYCPQSAGFGHFTCRKAGEPLTNSVSAVHHGIPSARNAAQDFFNIGTDALEMATDFCRSNNLEVFVSLRMNDQHDSSSSPGRGYNALYPQFKKDHPECLVGAFGSSNTNLHPLCRDEHWSCVNFACSRVREEMKRFVRQFLENYDIDGVEFDFNRHCVLFKSVAEGGVASDAERAMMTELMRDLRRIAEEVGRRRGRYFIFAMRSPDSLDFNREVGIDLARWFEEGLVDIWIGSGYFRLTPWEESVALAHKYGVKFYASLDESRIERLCRKEGLACIPGRETLPAYAAVMANARAAGVDGTYVFNREEEFLRQIARLDVSVSNAVDKLYFLRYRGSGGYRPEHWLYGGSRHDKLPQLDPGKANEPGFPVYAGGGCVRLSLTIDDDFDKVESRPTVMAKVLTNLKTNDELRLRIGNIEHRSAWSADGLFHFILTPGEVKRGENVFEVIFPKTGTGVKLLDFALEVRYPARHGKLLVSFDDRNFFGWEAALPLLAHYDSCVTFFVNGPIDDRAVVFMRKAKAAGHSLGLHGFGHMSAPKAVVGHDEVAGRSTQIPHS